jgi:putative toxin-antitoxin system antitoxin component (TIGR02293 family)
MDTEFARPTLMVKGRKTTEKKNKHPVPYRKEGTQSQAHSKDEPSFLYYMDLDSQEVIQVLRSGVRAGVLDELGHAMDVPRVQLLAWMDVPETTIKRKIGEDKFLSKPVGEQAVFIARLIGQVQQMVEESGEPENFDAAKWLAQWLSVPNPSLGGIEPGKYMDTAQGRMLVSDTLARLQSGAYA